MSTRYTVTVREVGASGQAHTARVLADSEAEAQDRALTRLFGRSAFWFRDSGVANIGNYGQVFEALPRRLGDGNTSRTNRARLSVERGW